jgi:hypothetical protein
MLSLISAAPSHCGCPAHRLHNQSVHMTNSKYNNQPASLVAPLPVAPGGVC